MSNSTVYHYEYNKHYQEVTVWLNDKFFKSKEEEYASTVKFELSKYDTEGIIAFLNMLFLLKVCQTPLEKIFKEESQMLQGFTFTIDNPNPFIGKLAGKPTVTYTVSYEDPSDHTLTVFDEAGEYPEIESLAKAILTDSLNKTKWDTINSCRQTGNM